MPKTIITTGMRVALEELAEKYMLRVRDIETGDNAIRAMLYKRHFILFEMKAGSYVKRGKVKTSAEASAWLAGKDVDMKENF